MHWRTWICKRLKQARQDKGLTQLELSGLVNVYHQLISKYESGRAVPSVDTIEKIAEVTGYTLDWFFQPPGTPQSPLQAARQALGRVERAEEELSAARALLSGMVNGQES